jgi:dimethylargininase
MTTALVRRPSTQLDAGIVTHIARRPVDVGVANRQWQSYVDALDKCGWGLQEVAPADDCPDGVFVEDTVVVFGDLAVITRPGAPARLPEVEAMPALLASMGIDQARIEAPGTLDGGDVLKHDDTVWVGLGGRTNASGIEQLTAYLEPHGAQVVPVPLSKVLHLKSAVTALPDGTVVGYEPLVDDPTFWPSFLGVPEESGSHVVLLGDNRVLMSADAPESERLFAERGLDVVAVDIGEFIKLEGCVTCLSVRLRHTP